MPRTKGEAPQRAPEPELAPATTAMTADTVAATVTGYVVPEQEAGAAGAAVSAVSEAGSAAEGVAKSERKRKRGDGEADGGDIGLLAAANQSAAAGLEPPAEVGGPGAGDEAQVGADDGADGGAGGEPPSKRQRVENDGGSEAVVEEKSQPTPASPATSKRRKANRRKSRRRGLRPNPPGYAILIQMYREQEISSHYHGIGWRLGDRYETIVNNLREEYAKDPHRLLNLGDRPYDPGHIKTKWLRDIIRKIAIDYEAHMRKYKRNVDNDEDVDDPEANEICYGRVRDIQHILREKYKVEGRYEEHLAKAGDPTPPPGDEDREPASSSNTRRSQRQAAAAAAAAISGGNSDDDDGDDDGDDDDDDDSDAYGNEERAGASAAVMARSRRSRTRTAGYASAGDASKGPPLPRSGMPRSASRSSRSRRRGKAANAAATEGASWAEDAAAKARETVMIQSTVHPEAVDLDMVYGLPPNARELAAMAATRATLPASIVGLDDERHDRLIATLETGFWAIGRGLARGGTTANSSFDHVMNTFEELRPFRGNPTFVANALVLAAAGREPVRETLWEMGKAFCEAPEDEVEAAFAAVTAREEAKKAESAAACAAAAERVSGRP